MFPTWLQKVLQQTIFFVSFIYTAFMVVTNPQWIYLLWLAIGMIIVAGTVSAYYHRYATHKSWNCPRWLEEGFLLLGGLFSFTQAISWVAAHRKHHRYADTDKDPHGPQKGFWGNVLISYYPINLAHAGRQNLNYEPYQRQLKYYFLLNLIGFVVMTYFFGAISWTIINTYSFVGQVCTNYFGHADGKPTTRPWLSPLLAGETYHELHHSKPNLAIFGRWDLGGWIIRLVDRKAV